MKKFEQARQSREKILKTAALCFAEKGYTACSMREIADCSGLSKGAIYGHFKSKEELFREMITLEHNRGAKQAAIAQQRPPYIDGIVKFMSECIRNSGYPIDHRLWAEVLAVSAREKNFREFFLRSEKATRQYLKELLLKARENGEISSDIDIEALSVWIFSLGDGFIIRLADDPTFDFEKNFPQFEKLLKNAISAR